MSRMRLQHFLAKAGVASRREAEKLILQGKVKVNGEVIYKLGTQVDPNSDQISFQNKLLSLVPQKTYILFHKPRGVIVTKKDPQKRKTVFDCIPNLHPSVNAVGRLDYDSEGLLLLTNDGDLAHQLTHPSSEIKKEYWVELNEIPSSEKLKQLEKGIILEGTKTAPARIQKIKKEKIWFSIEIHEGKKRQVRRMFEWAGVKVLRLVRVRIGSLNLGDLPVGGYRELNPAEIAALG